MNEALNRWRIKLIENLDVRHPMDALRQYGFLTREHAADIQAERTPQEKARHLLEKIEKNGPNAFDVFRQSLKEDNPFPL